MIIARSICSVRKQYLLGFFSATTTIGRSGSQRSQLVQGWERVAEPAGWRDAVDVVEVSRRQFAGDVDL